MAEFHEISPNAALGEKALNWVDNRFPLSKLFKEHMSEYYAPKNFNFWYIFGSLSLLVLGYPDRDRYFSGDALQARRDACFRIR
jgi:hypothetical protein